MNRPQRILTALTTALLATAAGAANPAFMSPYDPWLLEAPAPSNTEVVAASNEDVTIVTSNRKVTVNNAEGMTLYIFSITGELVERHAIDSPSKQIHLNVPNGIYLLRVGDVARKATIYS